MAETKPTVIVRRVKKAGHAAHHGGSWKVAYADFVTAMMAFFLVLWLMATTNKNDRAAISEYFRNPSPLSGQNATPAPGMAGPGGASTSMIKLGGATDISRGSSNDPFQNQKEAVPQPVDQQQRDKQQLEALYRTLAGPIQPNRDPKKQDETRSGLGQSHPESPTENKSKDPTEKKGTAGQPELKATPVGAADTPKPAPADAKPSPEPTSQAND